MAKREEINTNKDELKRKLVKVNRVTKVVKGGRIMRFSALVVVGDENGSVGIGMGKAAEVPEAIEKAATNAKKNMFQIPLSETTIAHAVTGKFGKGYVLMRPAPKGTGVIAGGTVRAVVELVGIKDITAKSFGSNNPVNCVKATLEGLKQLRSPERVAAQRGKDVSELID